MLLKEFINLDANIDMIIKNLENVELNTNIVSAILKIKTVETIYQYTDSFVAVEITKESFMKT